MFVLGTRLVRFVLFVQEVLLISYLFLLLLLDKLNDPVDWVSQLHLFVHQRCGLYLRLIEKLLVGLFVNYLVFANLIDFIAYLIEIFLTLSQCLHARHLFLQLFRLRGQVRLFWLQVALFLHCCHIYLALKFVKLTLDVYVWVNPEIRRVLIKVYVARIFRKRATRLVTGVAGACQCRGSVLWGLYLLTKDLLFGELYVNCLRHIYV